MYSFSDTENLLDAKVPNIPSTEVLVKALLVTSSAVLAASSSVCMLVILCSHHPCITGSAKADSVWKVRFSVVTPSVC